MAQKFIALFFCIFIVPHNIMFNAAFFCAAYDDIANCCCCKSPPVFCSARVSTMPLTATALSMVVTPHRVWPKCLNIANWKMAKKNFF